MRTTAFDQRPSGIDPVGALPWGTQFCVFFASRRELLEVLVPFVATGLACNELCSWEVRAPLTLHEVTKALGDALPGFAGYVSTGQIELLSPETPGRAPAGEVLESNLDRAILAGFDGLRLVRQAGLNDTRPALAADADTIGRLNVLAALVYDRAELGAVGVMQAVQNHRFALVCSAGRWEVLQGSEAIAVREALKRSEEKLQSLFSNMSEGFAYHRIVLDAAGRPCDYIFLDVNPAFERLTGLVAKEILGRRVTHVLPGIELDPADWIGRYGRVALTGEPVQFERDAAALGRAFAVSAFSPHKGYFAVTFSDITARKRAEALRRAAEERLLVTLQSIGDGVIATDTEGRVTLMNSVAESLTGWHQSEALGRPLCEVFPIVNEQTGEQAEDPVRKVLQHGGVVELANHTVLITKDAQRIAIADSAAPVRAGTMLLGVVLVFRDVTAVRQAEQERRRTEVALKEANEQLEKADRRKNEFLAVLSHELRNPLAPITNSLYVLNRAEPGGDQAKRAKDIIDRQVAHLSRLVDDLLDVTRVSRNKIQLQRQRIDLCDVVHRSVEDQRSLFERGAIRLESHLPPEPVFVHADATRVAQVVGNLLQNAAKFTPGGGLTRVSITLDRSQGKAIVRVTDTGVGMAPGTLASVFQPFMQADSTLDRSKGGLGLGLALVKGLVELHGGTVAARSDGLGKGAELEVSLPLDATVEEARHSADAPPPTQSRRVLIIEDNVDAAHSLRDLLELIGHEVAVAFDGPKGIAKARDLKPEVVLCDIGLPRMDGYQVARAMRGDATLAGTHLVALSGYALPEDLQRAKEAGFEGHVAKPISLDRLQKLLGAIGSREA